MEARAGKRYRAPVQDGTSGDPRYGPRTSRHARRPGVRRDRRKVPGHATDLFRTPHRGRPQSQRAPQDFIGSALLGVSHGAAGAYLSGTALRRCARANGGWVTIAVSMRLLLILLCLASSLGAQAGAGPPKLQIPAGAEAGPGFHVESATRAYLATFKPDQKARSDAYFEGGYWLQW